MLIMEKKRTYSDTKKGIKLAEKRRDDILRGRNTKEYPSVGDEINYNLNQADKMRISRDDKGNDNYSSWHLARAYSIVEKSDLSEDEKERYLNAIEKRARRLERTVHKAYEVYKFGCGGRNFEPFMATAIVDARDIIDAISEKRKKPKLGLEHKTLAVFIIAGILAGLFFLSPNFTGNVIGSLNQTSSNWLGAVLLVAGLVGGFFWLKGK